MYIKILPLKYFFINEPITYSISGFNKSFINIGSLVNVPIKKKDYIGIVLEISKDSDIENVRVINSIICSYPILDIYQIKVMYDLVSKYFIHFSKVLNFFMPAYIINRLEKTAYEDFSRLDNSLQKKPKKSSNLVIHSKSGNTNKCLLDNILPNSVIIFPDDFSIDYFLENNPEYKHNAIIYKNALSYTKKYKVFYEAISHKKDILIGTRRILQYNLGRYDNIFYLEEPITKEMFYMNQTYKNLDIVSYILESNKFSLIFISSVMSIDLLKVIKKYKISYKSY